MHETGTFSFEIFLPFLAFIGRPFGQLPERMLVIYSFTKFVQTFA